MAICTGVRSFSGWSSGRDVLGGRNARGGRVVLGGGVACGGRNARGGRVVHLEATPVLRGADPERAQERSAHRLGGAEAAAGGDRGERLTGLLERAARGLQAQALDVARGRD